MYECLAKSEFIHDVPLEMPGNKSLSFPEFFLFHPHRSPFLWSFNSEQEELSEQEGKVQERETERTHCAGGVECVFELKEQYVCTEIH